jgi:UDP-glucose 4-epimerase
MKTKILVTGGLGYIGSQTVWALTEADYEVVIFDRKPNHTSKHIPPQVQVYQLDLQDKNQIQKALEDSQKNSSFMGCIHFAADIEVKESQENPEKYYYNNFYGTLNLLSVLNQSQIKNLVFSSTAAVYGLPKNVPILETEPKNPINTYGFTKLAVEQMLEDYHRSYGFSSIRLRYFNACGADLKGRTGECHEPETHLIPILLEVAGGKREFAQVNGTDYQTPDGSCVRDYVHTQDLASAHILALQKMLNSPSPITKAINLGTKTGYSVLQIIEQVKKVTGVDFEVRYGQRRAGDPDTLVADNTLAKEFLQWVPVNSDLETIIKSAWNWYQQNH